MQGVPPVLLHVLCNPLDTSSILSGVIKHCQGADDLWAKRSSCFSDIVGILYTCFTFLNCKCDTSVHIAI